MDKRERKAWAKLLKAYAAVFEVCELVLKNRDAGVVSTHDINKLTARCVAWQAAYDKTQKKED